jgi:pimeloyl-ACP methyl ester carboxylesterase
MGDILVYMAERGTRETPGPIIATVIAEIENAVGEKSPDDPKLILVGHSLGGIILYEILSYYRPDIAVDVFASVGSQIGVLEEVKVLKASDRAIGPKESQKRVPPLSNVERWINIYDLNDPGSFATERIFEGSSDFRYTTGLSPRAAHSGYWIRPSFYERLAARVAEQ